jgi:tetratricopeptide (TPR) repeat protein
MMASRFQRWWPWLAAALIILFGWRDLLGIGSVLLAANAERLSGGDLPSQQRLLAAAEQLSRIRAGAPVWSASLASGDQASIAQFEAGMLNSLALLRWRSGEQSEAIALLRRAAQIDPDQAVLHFNLGMMLAQTNDAQGAVQALREATLIEPAWEEAQLQLASAYLAHGDAASAVTAARQALTGQPSSALAARLLASALVNKGGETAPLGAELERLLSQFPQEPLLRYYHAMWLRETGDAASAAKIMRNLLQTTEDATLLARVNADLRSAESPEP